MIGILLLTHGNIGREMLAVAQKLVDIDHTYVAEFSRCHLEDPSTFQKIVEQALLGMPNAAGFVVLTDLYGATPMNISQSLINKYNLSVISGLNMPMLLKALTYHKTNISLDKLAQQAYEIAKECIILKNGK